MQGRTRRDWDLMGTLLAARGVAALAIDLRNHGESSTGPGSADDSMPFVNDVRAALDYLSSRPDLVAGPRGIVGASVGANLAAVAAAGAPAVSALVLLSPGLDYRNVRIEQPLRKYGDRAALVVLSQEDPYAARSARVLATAGTGVRDVRFLEGAGHGTVMLSHVPDLVDTIVDWLVARLL
jgi:alpha-beta hydrolase superfamily lysophospholipase